MTSGDTFDALAALRISMPDSVQVISGDPEHVLLEVQYLARQERAEHAESLRMSWSEDETDPVISEIQAARSAMLQAERQLHLVIAFAREFFTPRPYPLEDIAVAAGMSISGVRTCYDEEDVAIVEQRTGRKPRNRDTATPSAKRRARRRESAGGK